MVIALLNPWTCDAHRGQCDPLHSRPTGAVSS